MLTIRCRLSPHHLSKLNAAKLSSANEQALRYDLFLGDVNFTSGACDFSTEWGWVPIVDFMSCMNAIVKDLLQDARLAHFEFTESDAKITFRNDGTNVRIASTYADGEFSVPMYILAQVIQAETKRLHSELVCSYPELRRNPVFDKLTEFKRHE